MTEHCIQSKNYVNVIVAGKQPELQWFQPEEAETHCKAGLGILPWASNDTDGSPDVILACCGDVPTTETLAAVTLLRETIPDLKVRVINIVDLMRLQSESQHPHGLSDSAFDALKLQGLPIPHIRREKYVSSK